MKKILAVALTIVMAAALATAAFAADPTPAASYTFDGNAADEGLTANGNMSFADGAATFGGADSWLSSDVDLTDANELTVAVRVKGLTNLGGGGQWIYDITSDAQHPGGAESYFGLYYENGTLNAEAYASGRSDDRAVHASVTDGDFVTIVVTYSKDQKMTVYVDGEVAGETTVTQEGQTVASMIGSSPVLQIGKCNWDSGYYANGLVIDSFAIYKTALTPEQAAAVFASGDAPAPGDDTTASDGDDTTAPDEGGEGGEGSGSGEKQPAPPTGFATVAIVIAAIGSGAYVVSRKQH